MLYFEENKPVPLFSFQKLNKYFLMPFFVPIICFTTKFFSERMKTDGWRIDIRDVTSDNTHTFVFLYQIIQSICLIFGGLLYFVSQHTSRSRRESRNTPFETGDSNSVEGNKFIKKGKTGNFFKKNIKVIKKSLIIILMPILLIIYNIGIAYGVKYPQLEKRVYFLLFITLINIIIFKKQIFLHQKLSFIITAIGAIPIYTAFFIYLDRELYNFFYDLFLLVGSFCYSLYLVFIKYLTCDKGMSVFLLLLYQGLLCFIYTIILFVAMSLINKGDFTYIYNIFHCTETNYICISYYYFKIIMYIILNTVLQALIFLVVYHFSPELFAISDIFSPLFSFIALWIETEEENGMKIFLTVLGYVIIAIASFIYNELIVLNFCGFNENTWTAIDQKAHQDIIGEDSRDSYVYKENYIVDIPKEDNENLVEMTNY